MPRTAPKSAPIISFWSFSSIAALNQLSSHLEIPQPFSKTQKSSTSRSLATLGGFSALAKMDFLARRRGWWWDRQNDNLLSPTRRCNYHWSSVLARRACALLAKHQGEPSHTLNVLASSTRHPPLSWTGLPRLPLRAEGSLTADLSDPGDSFCAASLLMVLRNLCVALAWAIPSLLKRFTVQLLPADLCKLSNCTGSFLQVLGSTPSMLKTHRLSHTVFCTKVTRPHRLQTKAFSIL